MPLTLPFGLEASTRMSVVRLSGEGGALWLHSPVALDRRLREDLEGLGRVRFVVCPNLGHHMFAGEYVAAYPDRSEEHTSELQSRQYLVCRLLLEKKKQQYSTKYPKKVLQSNVHLVYSTSSTKAT